MGMGKLKHLLLFTALAVAVFGPMPALMAQEEAAAVAEEIAGPTAEDVQTNLNIIWTCVAAFLVFFMQAGFAMVETGFTRAKNVVNIIMKNMMDFSIGSLAFFMIGFGIMFGANPSGGLARRTSSWAAWSTATASTRSGRLPSDLPDRVRGDGGDDCFRRDGGADEVQGYLVYSVLITAFVYRFRELGVEQPVCIGQRGWLEGWAFWTSPVRRWCTRWAAGWRLRARLCLAPHRQVWPRRQGAGDRGHNMALGALGVFILWSAGSGLIRAATTGDGMVGYIAVTTNLAAGGRWAPWSRRGSC